MEREEKADRQPETAIGIGDGTTDPKKNIRTADKASRSRSRRRAVSYDESTTYQDDDLNACSSATELLRRRNEINKSSGDRTTDSVDPSFSTLAYSPKSIIYSNENTSSRQPTQQSEPIVSVLVNGTSQDRPAADGKLFPFKLGRNLGDEGVNASTVTLKSYGGVATPKGDEEWKQLGGEMTNGAKEANGQSVGSVVQEAKVPRPEMERFETAREGP